MSATSEANSLGSFFAVGIQGAKGTAATTLYKLIATDSSLAPEFEYRDTRLEHPQPAALRHGQWPTRTRSPATSGGRL